MNKKNEINLIPKKRFIKTVNLFKIEEKDLIEKIEEINELQGFSTWVKEKLISYKPDDERGK